VTQTSSGKNPLHTLSWNRVPTREPFYDSGPQQFPYFYKITDKDMTSDMLQFNWNCDAQARITAFATPGLLGSSQSEGTITLESKVSDVSIEVVHGPTEI